MGPTGSKLNTYGALNLNGRVFITTPNKLTHMPKRGEKVFGEKKHRHHHAFSRDDLKRIMAGRKDVEIEELTTHNVALLTAMRMLYKIFTTCDSFQRPLQKIGKKGEFAGGRLREDNRGICNIM